MLAAPLLTPAWNEPLARELAERIGVPLQSDPYGPQAALPWPAAQQLADGFVAPLFDHGLLTATGEEASKFLHAQLTNDVEHLAPGDARWFGYCTAKGRLLGSFLGWRDHQGIQLVTSRALAAGLRKRLGMFVLRSKVTLADRSDELVVLGLAGARLPAALAALGLALPEPMRAVAVDGATVVALPAVGIAGHDCPRCLLAIAQDELAATWTALAARLAPAPSAAWRWTEVLAGVPRIVAGTSEQFVPQMINFELVGGVSFKKGCYPGQEVVARSQYLGKLKRRMFAAHLDGAEPAPGSDVVPAAGGEPVGQVVLAAPSPLGGVDLLFESQTAAVGAGTLLAGGCALQLRELPYPLAA
jgi:hypothetical protein